MTKSPLEKAITDISELKGSNGKVYVSAVFDCFDLMPLGLAIEDNMKASLCRRTLENAAKAYPWIRGCVIHSDRGSQYTSAEYRTAIQKYGIIQSMNSAGGRCHDNARCESMWVRMKDIDMNTDNIDSQLAYNMRLSKNMPINAAAEIKNGVIGEYDDMYSYINTYGGNMSSLFSSGMDSNVCIMADSVDRVKNAVNTVNDGIDQISISASDKVTDSIRRTQNAINNSIGSITTLYLKKKFC